MSTMLSSLRLSAFAKLAFLSLALSSAPTLFAAPELFWNAELPTGQWKAFGNGVLDSRALSNTAGLSIQVNWDQATFGTGAAYEAREGEGKFPALPARGKLTFEAKVAAANGATDTGTAASLQIRAEWLERRGNGGDQVVLLALSDSSEWQDQEEGWVRCEFEFNESTPRFRELRAHINALRIIFPKAGQSGESRVEIRNVEIRNVELHHE